MTPRARTPAALYRMERARIDARSILAAHRVALDRMANTLIAVETLDAEGIAALFVDVPKWRRARNLQQVGSHDQPHRRSGRLTNVRVSSAAHTQGRS